MSRDEREDAAATVAESRRDVEYRIAELRTAIGRETGVIPKARYTLAALAVAAVGVTLAAKRRKKKRRAIGRSSRPVA